jgi:CubicO group peptidase (beta-lactamase class C family)
MNTPTTPGRWRSPCCCSATSWTTPTSASAGGLTIGARDLAKIGLLYARDGVWDGARVLAEHWVDSASTIRSRPEGWSEHQGYGYGWWVTTLSGHHTFYALGYGGQSVVVVPDLDLVTVLTANPNVPQQDFAGYIQVMPDWVLPAVEGGRSAALR